MSNAAPNLPVLIRVLFIHSTTHTHPLSTMDRICLNTTVALICLFLKPSLYQDNRPLDRLLRRMHLTMGTVGITLMHVTNGPGKHPRALI